jgi:hypothetical protein
MLFTIHPKERREPDGITRTNGNPLKSTILMLLSGCSSYQPIFQPMASDNQPHPNSLCSQMINGPQFQPIQAKIWCNNAIDMFIPPHLIHFHGVRNCPIIP